MLHSILQPTSYDPDRALADRVARLFADVDRQMAEQNALYIAAGAQPSAVVTPSVSRPPQHGALRV